MATSVPSVRRTPAISIRLRVLVLPMVLAVFSSLTYSQNPESVQQPKEYEQFLAYWTTEAGWHSEVQLRNNLPSQELVVSRPSFERWMGPKRPFHQSRLNQ